MLFKIEVIVKKKKVLLEVFLILMRGSNYPNLCRSTSTDYIVAVFGRDEKFSRIIRIYEEQIILVDRVRCDMKANTALMHLHGKVQTTEKTKSLGIIST